eukprot:1158193-Pelagomonas_calceolata.AAC.6
MLSWPTNPLAHNVRRTSAVPWAALKKEWAVTWENRVSRTGTSACMICARCQRVGVSSCLLGLPLSRSLAAKLKLSPARGTSSLPGITGCRLAVSCEAGRCSMCRTGTAAAELFRMVV